MNRHFTDTVHGSRAGYGVRTLLADLEVQIRRRKFYFLAQDDIRNAFDEVNIDQCLHDFGRHIQDSQCLVFVELVLRGGANPDRSVGIAQGCPLSPLALNIHLHHRLDVPMRGPETECVFRYVDDVVLLSSSLDSAQAASRRAQGLLGSIGMSFKQEHTLADLRESTVELLGFDIRYTNRLDIQPSQRAWQNLEARLQEAHNHEAPAIAASRLLNGWIGDIAPGLRGRSGDIAGRVLRIARQCGFREITNRAALRQHMAACLKSWNHLRKRRRRFADVQ